MQELYHLKLDVKRVQDYIFQVPKLKNMLGANSRIGELFKVDLPGIMPEQESLFDPIIKADDSLSEDLQINFQRNIISSSGGHFEAVFTNKSLLNEFALKVQRIMHNELPDLEYSINYRSFNISDTLDSFPKEMKPIALQDKREILYDSPLFRLCEQDGTSVATTEIKDDRTMYIGDKTNLLRKQADKFYNMKAEDAISEVYNKLRISGLTLAQDIKTLANRGISKKDNMVAYIKIDGNGTGNRFRKHHDKLNAGKLEILTAFVEMEKFWENNRATIRQALYEALIHYCPTEINGKLPFLLLMLGGDDLFLVCIPEIALDLSLSMATKLNETNPISVGIAFVKESYPISLANSLAESCLECAKQKSSMIDSKTSCIDWHVHFDSVYQSISEIRRNSYMLEYEDSNGKVTEFLTKRPYFHVDMKPLLDEIKKMAKELDGNDKEAANNKIKSYRSVIKSGYLERIFYKEMMLRDNDSLQKFLVNNQESVKDKPHKIISNGALDKIELLEIYRKAERPKEKR